MDKASLISRDDVASRIWDRLKKDIRIYISLVVIVPLGFFTKFLSWLWAKLGQ